MEIKQGPHGFICPVCGEGIPVLTSEIKPGSIKKCPRCDTALKFRFDAEQSVKDTDKKLQEMAKKIFKK